MPATRNDAVVKLTPGNMDDSDVAGIYEPVIAGSMELVFTIGGDIVIAQAILTKEE